MGNTPVEKNVIWVDRNISNDENQKYSKDLKNSCKSLNVDCYNNVDNAINKLKTIKFKETYVITSGSFYDSFIKTLKKNINEIYTIPQIIIFTSENFKNSKNDIDTSINSFYHLGGIQTDFKNVINFILNSEDKRDIEEENQLTFEYIDCKEKLVLPTFYKALIELTPKDNIQKYNDFIYNNYSKNKEINQLFKSIKSIPDIPIELLAKYYARLYSLNSKFYNDINNDLRQNKRENHLQFIKIFYEGVRLKSLPLAYECKELYRGSRISNREIEDIKKYLKKKLKDLPGAIVFSRSFLSFTKDLEVAQSFLNTDNLNKDLSKVLYKISQMDILDYNLATHADITGISNFYGESEVLFFPFSCFEIQEVKETTFNNEKIYEIHLKYLGKYIKELENLDKDIPDSEFKKEISGLIPEKKLKKTKEVIKKFKRYNKPKCNIKYSNEINIKYETSDEKYIQIFGKNFVNKYKDKCKIISDNKEYNLIDNFPINSKKNKPKTIDIKLNNIKTITDMSYMFNECKTLISVDDISNIDTKNIIDMTHMFYNCKSLISLPDISYWDTTKVADMSNMFKNCSSLKSLPDISEWDIDNVTNISGMFSGCSSLDSLPDISIWNTKNIINLSNLFSKCSSLKSIPDISNWNVGKTKNISSIFSGCITITSLPDISKWNTNSVTNMTCIFEDCKSLEVLPDLSKWATNRVTDISNMFSGCASLISLPNISKWNVSTITRMSNMFKGCKPELSIPEKFGFSNNNVNIITISKK